MNLLWQARRSSLNHDWLKNEYVQALGRWRRVLDNEIEDPELEKRFLGEVLPCWEYHVDQAVALTSDFEGQMSPRALFAQEPLARCDAATRDWLGDLVHALWLAREPVRRWVDEAKGHVADATAAYASLKKELGRCKDPHSVAAGRRCQQEFMQFRQACLKLAAAIERFPRAIRVT